MKMPFGRYRGQPVAEVPLPYAAWLRDRLWQETLSGENEDHYWSNLKLCAALAERCLGSTLDDAVEKAIRQHEELYPTFDGDRQLDWVRRYRHRKLDLLFHGVAYSNQQRRKGDRFRRFAESQ